MVRLGHPTDTKPTVDPRVNVVVSLALRRSRPEGVAGPTTAFTSLPIAVVGRGVRSLGGTVRGVRRDRATLG
ncbi:hypothetical protein B4N89_27500 [Embleya scabrispora]|uniref:Uncharacterized protein n=1 Tax=Embleya scabrispora TaxID=159449 RepID=A0A1T3P539_9ACTN|nr:hypothetical protein B4N89_27500 [Embleya scabrispora]